MKAKNLIILVLLLLILGVVYLLYGNNNLQFKNSDYYSTDGKFIYYNMMGKHTINDADLKSFKILNNYYSKDKNNVYYLWNKLPKANANTFQVLNSAYAKDNNYVYDGFEII